MAKRERPRWGPGAARLPYGWRPWRVGQPKPPAPAAPPAAPGVTPAVAEVKSKTGTVVLVFVGLGVVTLGVLELTGVTNVFGLGPKPKPAAPTAATPPAAQPAATPPAEGAPAGGAAPTK